MSFPNFLETFQHFRFIYGFCYFWNCAKKMFGPKRLRPILFCVVNIQKNFGFYFAICLETFFWYTRTVLKYLLVCDFRLLYLEASVFHCVGGLFWVPWWFTSRNSLFVFLFSSKMTSLHGISGDIMWYQGPSVVIMQVISCEWFRFFVPKGWNIFYGPLVFLMFVCLFQSGFSFFQVAFLILALGAIQPIVHNQIWGLPSP